ncbi:hypothetical protein [Pedobacter sp. MW01-1-1]|uniref:hypothetical protein n=1 Tax=Pedobacter sp. MW01-1-1 TaxID=3383027 RepID=UPI003FEDEB08
MIKKLIQSLPILLIIVSLFSCNKKDDLEVPPQISEKDIVVENLQVGYDSKTFSFSDNVRLSFDASVMNSTFDSVVVSLADSVTKKVILKNEYDRSGSKSFAFNELIKIPSTIEGETLTEGKYTLTLLFVAKNKNKRSITEQITLTDFKVVNPALSFFIGSTETPNKLRFNINTNQIKFDLATYQDKLVSMGLYLENIGNPALKYTYDLTNATNNAAYLKRFYIAMDNLLDEKGNPVKVIPGMYKAYVVYAKENGISGKALLTESIEVEAPLLEYDITKLKIGSTSTTPDMNVSLTTSGFDVTLFGADGIKYRDPSNNAGVLSSISLGFSVTKDNKTNVYSSTKSLYAAKNGAVLPIYTTNFSATLSNLQGLSLSTTVVISMGALGSERINLGNTGKL